MPILSGTSNSEKIAPEDHGIDRATQWWCEAVCRPRLGDAIAFVHAPGAHPHNVFLTVSLPARDLDDAESTGQYAIGIARHLVRVIPAPDDQAAWETLKGLLSPDGPMGGTSQRAWNSIMEWLPGARQATSMLDLPGVEL